MSASPASIATSARRRTSRTSWVRSARPGREMNSPPENEDAAHMRAALALAWRGVGNTWPNPAVGCVVVKAGRVVGRGVTTPGGRPHAEPLALAAAGAEARGATVYVTLEPCCHWG